MPYPRRLLWDILPQNTPNSQNLLLRRASHGFHRSAQMLGCAVLPQNSQNSQNWAAWVWQGCHTLLHLCASVSSVGGSSQPEVSVRSVRSVGISFLPRNSQNPQNWAAWVWQGCHTLLHLCASVSSVGGSSLQEVLCIRCIPWELLHRLSVGAAETAAPPGGIHGSSMQISPPHHLTTTTPFHLEPSLLHVLPVLWVRLRHHLRLVDAQPGEHDCRRCERHRHAVVVVGVDRL